MQRVERSGLRASGSDASAIAGLFQSSNRSGDAVRYCGESDGETDGRTLLVPP